LGTSPSTEPFFEAIYVKSSLSGNFTIVNKQLVAALESRGLWDKQMLNDLKLAKGHVNLVDRIPAGIKNLYKGFFEIDPHWVVDHAAARAPFIDQAQSTNICIDKKQASGKMLDSIYRSAWKKGLKTTYYLRSGEATSVEQSTVSKAAATPACTYVPGQAPPDCEVCQ
jgi:ribonucleoside-diphosphate reductase alpha chain